MAVEKKPHRAGDTRRLVLEEAYALALRERVDESLRLIEESQVETAGGDDGTAGAVRLCRVRLLLAHGGVEDAQTGAAELEALAHEGGEETWRAQLELARRAHAEGRVADAATLLQQAIPEFRRRFADAGPAASALARLLSEEVSGLKRAARPAPRLRNDSAPDSASLLRLVELGKSLAAEADPDQVLRIVLHEAITLTGTERGFIVLVSGDDFEFALAENLDWSEVEKPSFEVSRTLIRRVLDERRPWLLRAPRTEGRETGVHQSLAEIGVRSVACIPILHGADALGVLYLDCRDPAHSFREPMERLLDLLAAQAGAALDNARAHRAKTQALEAAEESLRRHRSHSELRLGYGAMIGSSNEMQEVYRKLDRIAPTEMPVLVLGETGTGKELVARHIHASGPRAAREFVAANCAGIAESLLEAELFGHERGAFTGADRTRPGLFELAHRGTLFLDEVGDMSLRMQADLLRVLQSGEVRRVGGRETFHLDVRVIAATHRDLEELMRRGEFRQDLYYRLNVLSLRLPALRERAEDIPLLLAELMKQPSPEGRTPPRFSDRAMRRLVAYPWPGNVRELQNIFRRISVLGVDVVDERHLPHEILSSAPRPVRAGSLRRAEDDAVRHAVTAAHGNKAAAARILGVDRKTLYARLRRLADKSGRHRP